MLFVKLTNSDALHENLISDSKSVIGTLLTSTKSISVAKLWQPFASTTDNDTEKIPSFSKL